MSAAKSKEDLSFWLLRSVPMQLATTTSFGSRIGYLYQIMVVVHC